MALPVILAVDDEPEVLNFIERDLRRHYAAEFRVMKSSSGTQALETAQTLKQRGAAVALFLVDQRMPGMSGPGIPADIVPQIFDPFFTTKPPGEGTGLGLEITRRLVHRYHGDIQVESRPGRTEFRVSFPAAPDEAPKGS